MDTMELYLTFSSLRYNFDSLAKVGYFKIVLRDQSSMRQIAHYAYRVVMWVLVITYNLQHVIRVVQARHSTDQMVDSLFILLTTLNTLGKQVAFNIRSQRVDHIISLINGYNFKYFVTSFPSRCFRVPTGWEDTILRLIHQPENLISGSLFSATKPVHVELQKHETMMMSRLLKLYQIAAISCGCLWCMYPIINRVLCEPDQFTGYIPFDTTPTVAFALAHAYMTIVITLQAYGNVSMDCTIVALFSQAKTQIQMLRHNLEQLVDCPKINGQLIGSHNKQNVYKDNETERILLQRRFVRCVEHYKQIVWYVKEVEAIYGEAMAVQLLVMAWVLCMTVYKIVGLSILSAEFVPMAVYLVCMLAQLFIYCYFGTQLKFESELVNQSLYSCDWLHLSPRFRRQLLVMMQYCSRPIAPRIAYIVPMSLETYITYEIWCLENLTNIKHNKNLILEPGEMRTRLVENLKVENLVLKHSYTLFTFLDRR